MCVVSVTKRLGSQEFTPSRSVLIDCASAITLVESSVIALERQRVSDCDLHSTVVVHMNAHIAMIYHSRKLGNAERV